jgi:hypothetical protein
LSQAVAAQVQIHEDAEVTERSREGKRQIGSSRATSARRPVPTNQNP